MADGLSLSLATAAEVSADVLILGCIEGRAPELEAFPEEIRRAARELLNRPGWTGAEKQHAEASVETGSVRAVALHGLGRADELDDRRLLGALTKAIDAASVNGVDRLALALPPHPTTLGPAAGERVIRHLHLSAYRFDRYLSDPGPEARVLESVRLIPPPEATGAYAGALDLAAAVAGGASLTRDLANSPGNEATPAWMEEQGRKLAEETGMTFRVLNEEELAERGMGGLIAVGAGSSNKPRMVRLDWGEEGDVVALVGKGVTFDTGGISIKPSRDMDEMKYDKCGACTVLGIAKAVAALDLPVRLRVYVPLAENMPDGSSYRPGDIIRCYNGKTVEILNTDAEGRLILADALAWAVEENPDTILEYSTLTGASVVALGHQAAGLYTPDDELAGGLLSAAGDGAERLWRMPLWPEFVEQIKGNHGDLKNTGSRWGGANTAAAFLSQFVGDHRRWAHMDIAGPAYIGNEGEPPHGATGYGVSLTVNWLRGRGR